MSIHLLFSGLTSILFGLARKIILIFACTIALFSCSHNQEGHKNYQNQSFATIYEKALSLSKNEPKEAIKAIEYLERNFPNVDDMEKLILLKIETYYQNNMFDDVISTSEHFLFVYPSSSLAPKVLHFKGMAYYQQLVDTERDQSLSEKAKGSFENLVQNFPNSSYAQDASRKLVYINTILAAKELEIGRFYLNRSNYPAAINRFKVVLHLYDTTEVIPETLYRMVESYYALHLYCRAQQYNKILVKNFPNSLWSQRSQSLISSIKR